MSAFTEEDIENDALIKEEVAPKLQALASREHSRILDYYETLVVEDYGLTPGQDLADMLVRALDSEDFAERILNTEVNLRQARINSIREDDLEFVMELQDKFSDDDPEDRVGKFIDKYMENVVGGAGGIGLGVTDKREDRSEDRIDRKIRELRQERIKLEETLERSRDVRDSDTVSTSEPQEQEDRKNVSDLFDRGGSSEDSSDTVEEETAPDESEGDDDSGTDDVALSSEEGEDAE